MIDVDVLAVGTTFRDLIFADLPAWPKPGEEAHAGELIEAWGGIANQARAANALGLSTALCTALGFDPASAQLVADLTDLGIDTSPSFRQPGWRLPTTVALPADGDRALITARQPFGREISAHLAPGDIAARAIIVDLADPALPWLVRARETGCLVFGSRGFDPDWALEALQGHLACDVWMLNRDEATGYARCSDPEQAARKLSAHVPLVVVTLGAEGMLAATADGEVQRVPAPQVTVRSTTGAGDTALTAFAFAHLVRPLSLAERLELTTLIVAGVLERPAGAAHYPTLAELVAGAEPRASRLRELIGG